MPAAFRVLRNVLFRDEEKMRSIKGGIARGMSMPINRRRNIRPETGLGEIGIAPYVKDLSRSSAVAYDIGSHAGYYVLAFARLGVPTIVAFEPDGAMLPGLRATIDANQLIERVQVVDRYVGGKTGATTISLDEAVTDGSIPPPDVLKMDIDGGEVDALQGATDLLGDTHPSLVIEVHSELLEAQVIKVVKEAGYTRLDIIDNGAFISKVAPELRYPATHNRWLAAWHSDRVAGEVGNKRLPGMTYTERVL